MSIGISAALGGELAEARAEINRLRAKNERLRDAVIDCLSWIQCYCGNPYCGKCRATREADAALAANGSNVTTENNTVPMPANAAQAEGMVLIGMAWLRYNAAGGE